MIYLTSSICTLSDIEQLAAGYQAARLDDFTLLLTTGDKQITCEWIKTALDFLFDEAFLSELEKVGIPEVNTLISLDASATAAEDAMQMVKSLLAQFGGGVHLETAPDTLFTRATISSYSS